MAAPKKPAPKVIRPVVKAMTATPEKPAPDPMRVIGPAPGDLPAGSEGLVTQGPTQAGLDAAAKIDRQRVIANAKLRQAARQAGTSGSSASSSAGTKAPARLDPDRMFSNPFAVTPGRGAAGSSASSSGGAKPNPSASAPNAWFKRGPAKPKPAGRRRPVRPTTRTRA